ncbi:MAG TPA: hypothetical protein VE399_06055 [Gemmatimonadales bacterium]|nr:hypothetical protein [Gemmatimonadales bacterium]
MIQPDVLAQGGPGYRIRMPIGGSLGAPVRPPRLTGTTPSTLDQFGQRRGRSFIPYWPFGYYLGSDGYNYPEDSTGQAYSTETQRVFVQPAREVYPLYDTVTAVGPLQVSSMLVGSKSMVRLTWRDHGVGADQVAFFLADSARSVLTAETVRSPPFTALLEPASGSAYAGMTVVLPGGTLETQYVPYRRRAR